MTEKRIRWKRKGDVFTTAVTDGVECGSLILVSFFGQSLLAKVLSMNEVVCEGCVMASVRVEAL